MFDFYFIGAGHCTSDVDRSAPLLSENFPEQQIEVASLKGCINKAIKLNNKQINQVCIFPIEGEEWQPYCRKDNFWILTKFIG